MSEVRAHEPSGAAVHSPRPNTVPYNDWRRLDVPPVDAFEPILGVSVIVPYFEAPTKLALTLAGLEGRPIPGICSRSSSSMTVRSRRLWNNRLA